MSKRPEADNWGAGLHALECALELENKLAELLLDLTTMASASDETGLFRFMEKYLDKPWRNAGCLEHQLIYHKGLEKQVQQEDPFKRPAEGNKASLSIVADPQISYLISI